MGVAQRIAGLAVAGIGCMTAGAALAERPDRLWLAATFNDGNDKEAVVDLRARKARGEALTAMEEAILVAAARTGQMTWCDGKQSGNAFLVRIDGRDAIITSAHSVFEDIHFRKPRCDLSDPGYYANISFWDPKAGIPHPTDFVRRKVPLSGSPMLNNPYPADGAVSLMDSSAGVVIQASLDFAVFFLAEEISTDILPDGTIRGSHSFWDVSAEDVPLMRWSLTPPEKSLVLIGHHKSDGPGMWYQSCMADISNELVYHACDTLVGASSSVLLTYHNNEFVVAGMHIRGTEDLNLSLDQVSKWNFGIGAWTIRDFLSSQNMTVE
ncbi:MAG: hypothetical protein MUE52_21190 [Tabrizicola sp.]|jgi:hypothetical protein|nr:hypothetical protein [Tabrizicola sp.]